jgi:TPR repeat protein
MKRIATAALIILFTLPAWADFQDGWNAYERGDYATALQEWQPLADQGDASAQNNLGFMYYKGTGVPQDYVLAHMWWNLAAAQGADCLTSTPMEHISGIT